MELTALDYIQIQQLVAKYAEYIDTCSNNGYDYADLFAADGFLPRFGTARLAVRPRDAKRGQGVRGWAGRVHGRRLDPPGCQAHLREPHHQPDAGGRKRTGQHVDDGLGRGQETGSSTTVTTRTLTSRPRRAGGSSRASTTLFQSWRRGGGGRRGGTAPAGSPAPAAPRRNPSPALRRPSVRRIVP